MRRTALVASALVAACSGSQHTAPCPAAAIVPVTAVLPVSSASAAPQGPTPADAARFVAEVDKELRRLWGWGMRAAWVNKNFITKDTNELAADAEEANMAYLAKVIPEAARYKKVPGLAPEVLRQLQQLEHATSLPAPDDAAKRAELAKLEVEMESMYGEAKVCPKADTRLGKWLARLAPDAPKAAKPAKGGKASKGDAAKGKDEPAKPACLTLEDLSKILAEERDEAQLREAWVGWNDAARPMRPKYERFVTLANEGARTLGYADLGKLWNSGYDMSPEAFEQDVDRLWSEVKPLYEQLHCYARGRLQKKFGKPLVPDHAPIPAHLLGNMWAQDWVNVWDLLEPYQGQASLDVTKAMVDKKWDEKKVVQTAEAFFVGLGLDPLPKSFWERSLFVKPKDREVVCHASAWDVGYNDDLRIKMCVNVNEEDLLTAHHELGHVYYFHAYNKLPILLQEGANTGFHEGIGDTLALSVTPKYLKDLGLIPKVPDNEKGEVNVLMRQALGKIAFLPFGLILDRWRWEVFSGKTTPSGYEKAWNELRTKFQGVSTPVPRADGDFDPGAKYHIASNTSYTRYFLATIYQFQFHRALCEAAGHKGPLHTCSIAGSKAAGQKLDALLRMGASKPWPEAMKAITGQEKADATAIRDYFAPLQKWLQEQNKGAQCGW